MTARTERGGSTGGGPAWRLIVDGARSGAFNMAADAAVLESRASGECPATLRLYSWERPTVSLGRFQDERGVSAVECARRGFDIVRRPTGGRAVLHADELTYCVVASVEDGVPRGVAASYRFLCRALVTAYGLLGVDADLTARDRGDASSAACYLHATRADLSIGAAKLSGSAQVWRGNTVMQHGSFVVARDVSAEAAIFGLDEERAGALARETRTIEEVLGRRPTSEELTSAVVGGFERALGAGFAVQSFDERETARIQSDAEGFAVVPRGHNDTVKLR